MLGAGAHAISPSFFAPTGTVSPQFNGGAMQGFFFPQDTTVSGQMFSCRLSGQTAVSTTVVTICTANIVLPYRASVWAQFTTQVKAPTGFPQWIFASIAFDGDAVPLVQAANSADANFLALGPAHTYVQSFKSIGQGRVAVLAAGAHTVSVVSRASSAGAAVQSCGMEGFFVANPIS